MLQRKDQVTFEATLYHQEVRSAVLAQRHHAFFSDHWADLKVQGVQARNENEAFQVISDRYPPEDGFVIEKLVVMN